MGLIRTTIDSLKSGAEAVTGNILNAGLSSLGSTIKDQYLEYFYCDALDDSTLCVKGKKRDKKGLNKGTDNIISNGSMIIVNEGQCMIIVDQGKIVDFCAEAGEFIYDTSSEPSLLCGKLGENIKKTFEVLGKRIAFGSEVPKDQRVYYIKINEVRKNQWGTQNPIPFFIHDKVTDFQGDIGLIANGEFIYKITDPIIFYRAIGNVPDSFKKETIHSTLRAGFLTALQSALGGFSEVGLRYSQITTMTQQLVDALNTQLSKTWGEDRGITLVDIMFNTIKATDEDEKRIKSFQDKAVYGNAKMAAARLVTAQADAMEAAASNESAGPMMAFAGMNMAQMVGGGINAQSLFAMGQQQDSAQAVAPSQAPAANNWTCSCGNSGNTGKFCNECGKAKPADVVGWTCSCGAINKGKFCSECGTKKPDGAPLYKCDKCGWEPEDPHNPPKFCPECGDIFDENDKI